MKALKMLGSMVAAALLVGAFTVVLWPETGARKATTSPDPAATLAAPATAAPPGHDHAIGSGETLVLSAGQLPSTQPLMLALDLEVASVDLAPRPIRVIAPDGRVLEQSGPVEPNERRIASLQLDPAWLTAGRYIVEVKTTERTHFPLRRYAIELR